MTAFLYRMGAGSPGDVNRTHPVDIEACLIDSTSGAAPTSYGQAVLLNTTSGGISQYAAGAITTSPVAYGVTVRPYPIQAASATNYGAVDVGAATPATSGIVDVCRRGYVMVSVQYLPTSVTKGSTVYVRCTTTSAARYQGGFEGASDAGINVALTNCIYNGVPDSNGVVEIAFNI